VGAPCVAGDAGARASFVLPDARRRVRTIAIGIAIGIGIAVVLSRDPGRAEGPIRRRSVISVWRRAARPS
jgi:hypothetical protein